MGRGSSHFIEGLWGRVLGLGRDLPSFTVAERMKHFYIIVCGFHLVILALSPPPYGGI